jgi:pimeloyl-ACP methyl ester carboxylesterase
MATRRGVITASLGTALSLTVPAVQAQTASKTFVLVHGAWGGGWVWRRVTDLLENQGHKVFAPTMTGLGERSHLFDGKVNLTTHITDIVNLIKWERLDNVVLVGHSYGGTVINGVAEQTEKSIGSIVFPRRFRA